MPAIQISNVTKKVGERIDLEEILESLEEEIELLDVISDIDTSSLDDGFDEAGDYVYHLMYTFRNFTEAEDNYQIPIVKSSPLTV